MSAGSASECRGSDSNRRTPKGGDLEFAAGDHWAPPALCPPSPAYPDMPPVIQLWRRVRGPLLPRRLAWAVRASKRSSMVEWYVLVDGPNKSYQKLPDDTTKRCQRDGAPH